MEFIESDLLFSFAPNWLVKRFDQHKFYKAMSGRGLKGVDCMAILDDDKLVLIEIKNYCKRKNSPKEPNIEDIIGNPPKLQEDVIIKFEDTFLCIQTVNQYFKRKWRYKLLSIFKKVMPFDWFSSSDYIFWTKAKTLIDMGGNHVHLVLWLEHADSYSTLDNPALKTLTSRIEDGINNYFDDFTSDVYVLSTKNNKYKDSLQVSTIL